MIQNSDRVPFPPVGLADVKPWMKAWRHLEDQWNRERARVWMSGHAGSAWAKVGALARVWEAGAVHPILDELAWEVRQAPEGAALDAVVLFTRWEQAGLTRARLMVGLLLIGEVQECAFESPVRWRVTYLWIGPRGPTWVVEKTLFPTMAQAQCALIAVLTRLGDRTGGEEGCPP
jgi:hypothetical protein